MPIRLKFASASNPNGLPLPKGLNNTEERQVRKIAKNQIRLRSETIQRAWYYPAGDQPISYRDIEHNKPFFLFGGKPENGLLNLGNQDDPSAGGPSTVVRPEGGGLPEYKPGFVKEGSQVRLQSLKHYFAVSGFGAAKQLHMRVIMFEYPVGNNRNLVESDILNQPDNVGVTFGFNNLFLSKNVNNGVGIKFLSDKTYIVGGQSSGAASGTDSGDEINWGYSGCRTFTHHYIPKNGRVIKYGISNTNKISDIPAKMNIGMLLVPFANVDAEQGQKVGVMDLWGTFEFKDM